MTNPAVARRDQVLPRGSSHATSRPAWSRRAWQGLPLVGAGIGCVAIAVLAAARPVTPEADAGTSLVGLLVGVGRLTGYAAVTLFVGTVAVWLLVWPSGRDDRRLTGLAGFGLLLAGLSGLLGMIAILARSGPTDASHLGMADPASFTTVTEMLLQRPAAPSLARLAICAVGVAWLAGQIKHHAAGRVRPGHSTAGTLVVVALALTVVTARPGPLPIAATALTELHVIAAAGWVGGLAALAVGVVPRRDPIVLHATLGSFSWLSMASVAILAVTGTAHALLHTGGLSSLISSAYGGALLAKLLAVAGMLAAATGSHHYVRRLRSRPAPVQVIALCIGAELALGAAALVLTSALVTVATRS